MDTRPSNCINSCSVKSAGELIFGYSPMKRREILGRLWAYDLVCDEPVERERAGLVPFDLQRECEATDVGHGKR